MNRNSIYTAHVEHVSDMVLAYQKYQNDGIASQYDECIYEFTGHFPFTRMRSSEIQLGLGSNCNHLQHQLSRSLIGNGYRREHRQHLQPMIICFFDQEGSRRGHSSDRCEFPHVHGICVIHPSTKEAFMRITKRNYDGRFELITPPPDFREITFGRTNNGTNGIMGFTDYALKSDKIKSRSDDNLFTFGVYPDNTSWNKYLSIIPESELRQHSFIKNKKMH